MSFVSVSVVCVSFPFIYKPTDLQTSTCVYINTCMYVYDVFVFVENILTIQVQGHELQRSTTV